MDNKKIGAFILELRKEKYLTQYELADLIPITRETVSKWERGVAKPSKSSMYKLSEIFDVTIEELLSGERLNNKNNNSEIVLDIYEDRNKKGKILKILMFIIVLLILTLATYVFLNTYNSIKVYTINYADEEIIINDGIFVLTKDKMYFNLGNVVSENEIDNLNLYYKNTEEQLIYFTNDKTIILYDYYGYNNYFDYDNIKNIVNNLYLKINSEKTIKLNLKKEFANNYTYFFNKKQKKLIEENTTINFKSSLDIEQLKKKFKLQESAYVYKEKNYTFYYFADVNLLNLSYEDNKIKKEWNYYLDINHIEFKKYQEENLINSYYYENNKITCHIEDCEKSKEEINIFFKKLNSLF